MQAATGNVSVTESVSAVRQLGPFVALGIAIVLFACWLLYYKIIPFMQEQSRGRRKFNEDLVKQSLASVDAARMELPAALEKVTNAFQSWGDRTEHKIDALPEKVGDVIEGRWRRIIAKESDR